MHPLRTVHNRIREAAQRCGRNPSTVRLVAVSKTVPAERVREAIRSGAAILGENYIQEALEKINLLSSEPVSWHFIGHLQTNKAKYAVKAFDLIHSVDSFKLAKELNAQAKKIGKIQDILLQIDLAGEAAKSGIPPDRIKEVIQEIILLPHIAIRGLMTLPPFFDEPEKARPFFAQLRHLRDAIRNDPSLPVCMDELSMGMTGDFEVAIEEGATLVRIGTAIFGERP